jgi:hypothetical protein
MKNGGQLKRYAKLYSKQRGEVNVQASFKKEYSCGLIIKFSRCWQLFLISPQLTKVMCMEVIKE